MTERVNPWMPYPAFPPLPYGTLHPANTPDPLVEFLDGNGAAKCRLYRVLSSQSDERQDAVYAAILAGGLDAGQWAVLAYPASLVVHPIVRFFGQSKQQDHVESVKRSIAWANLGEDSLALWSRVDDAYPQIVSSSAWTSGAVDSLGLGWDPGDLRAQVARWLGRYEELRSLAEGTISVEARTAVTELGAAALPQTQPSLPTDRRRTVERWGTRPVRGRAPAVPPLPLVLCRGSHQEP
ncbi:MAG: hypothetical protein V9F04_04555 [Dermatophilaceae bacterium]